MNFIDKAIGFLSPKWEHERQVYRAKTEMLRKYDAAGYGRRTEGLRGPSTSVNAENLGALYNLRNSSRQLMRNNPYAGKALRAIHNNVVGAGIRLSLTGNKAVTEKVKKAWTAWAEKKECDNRRKLNFYGIQKLVMRAVAESGECFVLRRRNTGGTVPFCLDVLESDYVDNNRNIPIMENRAYVIEGVQFDENDRVMGYWMFNRHPGEAIVVPRGLISRFVPVSDVIHVYEPLRPQQARGVPMGTGSMLRLQDFDEYEDAELIGQKLSACQAAFVSDYQGESLGTPDSKGDLSERLEPGAIMHLPNGKQVTFNTPPTKQGYGDYSHTILHGIAAGYNVTYEIMTGDLSRVNYSSLKGGRAEFQKNVVDWQENMMIPMLCEEVFTWFIDGLIKMGVITEHDEVTAVWTAPRVDMIDPVKETKGLVSAIRAGLISWRDAVKSMGYDPDELAAELQKDKELWDKLKLKLDVDVSLDLQPVSKAQTVASEK